MAPDRVLSFVSRNGRERCLVCQGRAPDHQATCPIVVLHQQLLELTAHLGIFVANMRDSLETIDAVLKSRSE